MYNICLPVLVNCIFSPSTFLWCTKIYQLKVCEVLLLKFVFQNKYINTNKITQCSFLFFTKGLEMDQSINTSQYFPVIARQAASMAHFKDTILKGAEDALKAQHLSPEVWHVNCKFVLMFTKYGNGQSLPNNE